VDVDIEPVLGNSDLQVARRRILSPSGSSRPMSGQELAYHHPRPAPESPAPKPLTDADRDFLLDWCHRLEPQTAGINQAQAPSLVHGDAHVGNLLRADPHHVVLGDFDATCQGPWQFDLVAVPVGEARFGRPGAHASRGQRIVPFSSLPTKLLSMS
jgi:Ser/Thr protein kinase RdoA (MazF antagonist)